MQLNVFRAFFRTPKGMLIIILAMFIAIAAQQGGLNLLAPGLLVACAAAAIVDAVILRLRCRKKIWEFPDGAILTAMIVAMVLRPQEPAYVVAATSTAAVLSKYIFRSRSANVFNPAALGIVGSYFVFNTGQSWWGALPEQPLWVIAALIAGGVFITQRVNKLPLVIMFLGVYYSLFTITAFVSDPRIVAEVYRAPDLHAALFFAFIILTDPPTSPAKYPDQLICGALVALVAFSVFQWIGAVYYLLAGVLVGNVWEAWRRVNRRNEAPFPGRLAAFGRELAPWSS